MLKLTGVVLLTFGICWYPYLFSLDDTYQGNVITKCFVWLEFSVSNTKSF